MTRRILISGSIAFDTIMVFDGHFRDRILPERTHMLSVSFQVPQLKREFGGTAANIAYNLAALGGEPAVLATVGRDGADYVERLRGFGVDVRAVRRLDHCWTAQCFVTTDMADNQINAFHPGAMDEAHTVTVPEALPAAFGIVAPNGKQAMLEHAAQLTEAGVPWIFDPGQGLPMFDGDELRALVGRATAVAVNDYECALLCDRTGWDEARIAQQVGALIVTHGAEGSVVWTGGQHHAVAAVRAESPVDPTGCGDAFRGGMLHGLSLGLDWVACARIGSVMGAIKIEHPGAQNHPVTADLVARRHEAAFGAPPW